MLNRWLLVIWKLVLVASPVFVAVLAALKPGDIQGPLFIAFVAASGLAVLSGANSAFTDPLGAHFRSGMRRLYVEGSQSVQVAENLVANAKESIKVIDTYWGGVNQFRASLQRAILASPRLSVRILLARENGFVARIRDAAMPGEVAVDDNLPACIKNIAGLREQIERISPGAGARISLRFYDATVMGPMIIVDDRHAVVGTFLQSGGSPITPAFEFAKPSWGAQTFNHFVVTFDAIWKHAVENSASPSGH